MEHFGVIFLLKFLLSSVKFLLVYILFQDLILYEVYWDCQGLFFKQSKCSPEIRASLEVKQCDSTGSISSLIRISFAEPSWKQKDIQKAIMWKSSIGLLLFTITFALYVQGDGTDLCPMMKCKDNCNVYEKDGNGCKTCTCKHLCKDTVCGDGMVCKEFLIHSNNSYVASCVNPMSPAACQHPPDASICRSNKVRWYYNSDLNSCRQFTYGGCLGNSNNYLTRRECSDICVLHNRKTCPEVMCAMYCEKGFLKDEDGCDICKCREEEEADCDLSAGQCTEHCPHGYSHKKDSQGCLTCECRLPDQCPQMNCNMFCQFGFKRDYNGCQLCECIENPCSKMMCGGGEVCELVPICSPTAHNNCFYHAKCSASFTITKIRVQLVFEHQAMKKNSTNDLSGHFGRMIKERLLEIMEAPEAAITFIGINPDEDIYHVTFNLINHGESQLVSLWRSVEHKIREDMNKFVFAYEGHIFTPKHHSMVASYFGQEHSSPHDVHSYFISKVTFLAISLGLLFMTAFILFRVKKSKRPPQQKRINIIYKQAPAPDMKSLI